VPHHHLRLGLFTQTVVFVTLSVARCRAAGLELILNCVSHGVVQQRATQKPLLCK
jgi:hypothetical protein